MLEYLVASERRRNNNPSVLNQADMTYNSGLRINATGDIIQTNTLLTPNIMEVPEDEERSASGSQNEPDQQEREKMLKLQEIQFQMQETQLRFEELRKKQNEL